MKRFGLFVLLFSITSVGFAQVRSGGAFAQSFGFSNSVVDQNGNVLIFDEAFSGFTGILAAAPTSLSAQTHVIVVSADGKTVTHTWKCYRLAYGAIWPFKQTFEAWVRWGEQRLLAKLDREASRGYLVS